MLIEKLNSVFRIKLCFSEFSFTNAMFYMSVLPSLIEKLNSVFRIKLCFSEFSFTNAMFYMSVLPSKGGKTRETKAYDKRNA